MIPPAIPGPDHIEAPPGFEPRTCVRPPADVRTCVRHDLCTIANALLRRTLARAVRSASDAEHWQEIAEDFDDAAHAAPMETWRGARAASRAAEELGRGLVGDAAAALADYYGLTVDAWHATTAAEIAEGAR